MPNICIYCGSKTGNSEDIKKDIETFCEMISQNGFDLVYGGSNLGTMGFVADIFRKNRRKVIGVRPKFFIHNENYEEYDMEMIAMDTMAERKMKMLEISDIVVTLPGGIGTLDEITEAHCLASINKTTQLICILNSQNFYSGLLQHFENIEKFGYSSKKLSDKILIEQNPEVLAKKIMNSTQK